MELSDWYYSVSPNELKQIASYAGTSAQYLRMIKSDWSNPSLNLQLKIIEAAMKITPDRVPQFRGSSLRPGRKSDLSDSIIKKMISDYQVAKLPVKSICNNYAISEGTFDRYLKIHEVKRDRWRHKRVGYGKSKAG